MQFLKALKVPLASLCGATAITICIGDDNAFMTSLVAFHVYLLRHRRFQIPPMRSFPYQKLPSTVGIFTMTVAGFMAVEAIEQKQYRHNASYHKEQFGKQLEPRGTNDAAKNAARVTLVAPVLEESLFRAILLPHFQRHMAFTPAVLLSSTFFGVLHAPDNVFGATAFGIGQCILYKWLNCHPLALIIPMATHCAWNSAVLAFRDVLEYPSLNQHSPERKLTMLEMMHNDPEKYKGLQQALSEGQQKSPDDRRLASLQQEMEQTQKMYAILARE